MTARAITAKAMAKLTLSLRVKGVRADGFHELLALVVSLTEPHDRLGLRIIARPAVQVFVDGPAGSAVPSDGTNLAARAARLLIGAADPTTQASAGFEVSIHKRIPAGAGLGGGSADAAATLVAGAALLGLDLDHRHLAGLAASLGSDVPFCLTGGAATMAGRGERITPRPPPRQLHVVVAIPPFALATADVYRAWDALGGPASDRRVTPPPGVDLDSDGFVNDLEAAAAAVEPRVVDFREALERIAGPPILAGSGSSYTVFAGDADEARHLAARLDCELPDATTFPATFSDVGVALGDAQG